MPFKIDDLNKLLPPELSEPRKGRLKDGLKQFSKENKQDKYYNAFYSPSDYNYFLQGDLIKELRFPMFNTETREYEKIYFDAILLSNTCDMDEANPRKIKKNITLAKLIPIETFIKSLDDLKVENAAQIITEIKNQNYSNVFYLPPTPQGQEYIAYLDEISWISSGELNALKTEISENRISSLDLFGHYLFIFKLSYHLLRLPEETHR